jgi:hypothetical protein
MVLCINLLVFLVSTVWIFFVILPCILSCVSEFSYVDCFSFLFLEYWDSDPILAPIN